VYADERNNPLTNPFGTQAYNLPLQRGRGTANEVKRWKRW